VGICKIICKSFFGKKKISNLKILGKFSPSIHQGREGGIQEALTNYQKAYQFYFVGIFLLEQLLREAKEEKDRELLRKSREKILRIFFV
jgi:hypothetical protein